MQNKKFRTSVKSTWTCMQHRRVVLAKNEAEIRKVVEEEIDIDDRDECWVQDVDCEDIVQVCDWCEEELETDEEEDQGLHSKCAKYLAEAEQTGEVRSK